MVVSKITMHGSRTLAEIKRRLKEHELAGGERDVHGRRFVNWLIQGGNHGPTLSKRHLPMVLPHAKHRKLGGGGWFDNIFKSNFISYQFNNLF